MRKKIICASMVITLILSLLLPMSAMAAGEQESAVSAAKSAVVRVFSVYDGYYTWGSAFGVGEPGSAPQYFVTNAHNVLDEDEQLAEEVYILLDDSAVSISYDNILKAEEVLEANYSQMTRCDVVNKRSVSLYPDVAILKAAEPIEGRTTLPLRENVEGIAEATPVHALGYPADLDLLTESKHGYNLVADIEDVSVTSGTVTKITNSDAFNNTKVIIHTATVAHGNSGGPLIDDTGMVIGINTYVMNVDTQRNISVAIDYAVQLLDEYHIPHSGSAKAAVPLKTIVLAAIIAVIVIVAVILILSFRKSGKKYLEAQEEKETKELRLQGVSGYFAGRRFPIDGQITIGRAPSNNIVFPTTTEGVSSNHCVIVKNGDQLYIKDANSSYGTFINGEKRIPPNQLVTLKIGDKIALGSERESFMITRKGGKI